MDKKIAKYIDIVFPETGGDIRARVFDVLAVCGVIVCVVTAISNIAVGAGFAGFFQSVAGAVISLILLRYTRKTGKYRTSMILTILIIFLGLFTFFFFTGGGYQSGMPCFFVFAVVFTAFMLDGIIMPVFVIIELIWYSAICVWAWIYPESVTSHYDENDVFLDTWVGMIVVSLSLAVTMYLQIRIYKKKEQELSEAILEAEEANKAKSDFLAKMSHDIRTPINTIMAMNEMIVSNTSSARIREWVNDSNVSGNILLSLIDDMLDLTKIEAGRIELLKQPWDTARLFEDTERIWKPQADRVGLDLSCEIDPSVPGFLIGDEDAIRKITNNLLSNSIKYTKTGSVKLSVIWGPELVITVSDTGVGIAPEYLKNIFKPFERGVQEIYKETSGSGLGLAIVKELVDAMEGTIDCDSTLNEGTAFTVRLPLKEYKGNKEKTDVKSSDALPEKKTSKRFVAPDASILVVDDTIYNHKVIEGFLEPALVHIDGVESGFEALEMIDIKKYDLILMDLRMPKMDGAETLDRIKEEYPDFDTPVVLLTADIMNNIKERMLERGFADFIAKPVSSARLYETICRFIPDKIVSIDTEEEEGLTVYEVESFQDMLMPYGINIKTAIENNAGDVVEFLKRAALFEEYADDSMERIREGSKDEEYYIQMHSTKSAARGIGAYLLAELAETIELRKDDDFTRQTNPVLLEEIERVRKGIEKLSEEMEQKQR